MKAKPLIIMTAMLLLAAPAMAGEQLIVFTQPNASALAGTFQAEHLPAIEKLADDMGVAFKAVDATAGAPDSVGITPLIVYQNHRGRSVYQGRYTTLPRLKNFIRTARYVPKAEDALTLTDLYVWDMRRAKVGSPIKITNLAGTLPEGFDQAAFKAEMRGALAGGFKHYQSAATAAFDRTDRLFYMDLYPYRAEDGTLYVSVALFSQFHCHDPVFVQMETPVSGPWEDRAEVFARAAAMLEAEVARQITSSKIGDGFDVVSTEAPTKTFDDLGLPLPAKPAGGTDAAPITGELPATWAIDAEAAAREPMIQFAFAAPLDSYAGEVADVSGTLAINKADIAQTTGTITVQTESLTMGEEDLDAHIHGGLILVEQHPTARFEIRSIQTDRDAIAWSQITPVVLVGRFTLMDKTIDLTVPASIEPYIAEDGSPRLEIIGTWQLRIDRVWGLAGPDGPADASNTMNFRSRLILKASE